MFEIELNGALVAHVVDMNGVVRTGAGGLGAKSGDAGVDIDGGERNTLPKLVWAAGGGENLLYGGAEMIRKGDGNLAVVGRGGEIII